MSVTAHDGGGGATRTGLIIPENIPGDDLIPARLEVVAGTLRAAGSQVLAQSGAAESSWSGLPAVVESPQGAVIYAALGTPTAAAAAIERKFGRVADALEEFAAAVRPIKSTFADIKADAVAFRATIRADERVWVLPSETHEYQFDAQASVAQSRGYVRTSDDVLEYLQGRGEATRVWGGRVQILAHWTQSSEHIDTNNALMDRLADAYTRLQNAEADCANAINRQRDLCMVEVEHIEAWQLKQSGENTVVLPWGSRVDEDRNCGESFWWGVGNAGKEALVGAAGLIGYNGVRNDWSPEQAGQSWLGAVQGIGALLVITSPPLQLLGMAGVPVLKEANAMGQEMVKGLLAWDTWAENPAEASGRVLVNVGSMFIPGAGAAGAAIKALSAGSHIIDLAADASRLGTSALNGLNKVDDLTGVLDDFADLAGTSVRVDDLVTVGSRVDMPDSDLLHVGTKADTPPPASFVDDGPSGHVPKDPAPPPPRADDPTPPPRADGDSENPGAGSGGADTDAPAPERTGDDTPPSDDGDPGPINNEENAPKAEPDAPSPTYDLTHPQEVYDHSVHNASSHDVMLGKWVHGDPEASYTGRAEAEGYTYFSNSEWQAVKAAQGLDDQGMFDLYNTWFLDQQIFAGKTIHFSHPPIKDGSFLGQELAWLEYRGYRYDPETMTAVPGGQG